MRPGEPVRGGITGWDELYFETFNRQRRLRQTSGSDRVIHGEKYQNAKTGRSYILKIIRGNTILLEEENGKGQLLMSYEQFEKDYVKSCREKAR